MNERITLVGIFDKKNSEKITKMVSKTNQKLCKVPFGKKVTNRYEVDTLPYHFTLSAWDISQKEEVLNKLSNLKLNKVNLAIDDITIMNGAENSYVLHFNIKPTRKLRTLQETIYNALPTQKYNPSHIKFHITIHIDKDLQKTLEIKRQIEQDFTSFELKLDNIGLFEIYPAKLVTEYNLI